MRTAPPHDARCEVRACSSDTAKTTRTLHDNNGQYEFSVREVAEQALGQMIGQAQQEPRVGLRRRGWVHGVQNLSFAPDRGERMAVKESMGERRADHELHHPNVLHVRDVMQCAMRVSARAALKSSVGAFQRIKDRGKPLPAPP